MASIINSSIEVSLSVCVVFPAFASSVKGLQGHKGERKRLIETTTQQRNKSRTSPSMSVASTLYTRGYFAEPDHYRSVFFVR